MERTSLVRQIGVAFCGRTVTGMTTAGPAAPRQASDSDSQTSPSTDRWAGKPGIVLSGAGLIAALLGSQTIAASTPLGSDVRLLLPSEGLLAGLGDGLRRGYGLAMEESAGCGARPPSLQLGWLPPGADPRPALRHTPRSALLVAPAAAPLKPYGELAEQQRISVLLPLQRGRSLEGLPQLRGADRLWPIVPARSLEADRLAEALLAEGIQRVMVVRDPSAESRALSDRFVASFRMGKGTLVGVSEEPISLDGRDKKARDQLVDDVDWYRPAALVVLTAPSSTVAARIRQADWPEGLILAWPFRAGQPLEQPQLSIDPQSRGKGWKAFARQFERRWGYTPGLVESAGYDTGLIAAIAAVPVQAKAGWDLQWFNPRARPLPLCEALQQRRQGAALRPQAATSRLDQSAGISPGAELRIRRVAARQAAPPPS